jgi:pSer/pThr/pTyr-binding forkhead associated (FHA) protein
MSALVVQVPGHGPGMFTEEFMIGRRGDPRVICALAVDDEYLSSPHARFFPVDGAWYVEDLGSTNGIYLNGSFERAYGAQRLAKGDQIRVGHTVLTVVPIDPSGGSLSATPTQP